MRKTVNVAWLVDKTNQFLATSEPKMTGERRGMTAVLEAVLFETGQYKGYGYLPSQWNEGELILAEDRDETRRHYYGGTVIRVNDFDCETEDFALSDCKHWHKPGTECSGPRVGRTQQGVILCEGHYNQ